MPVKRKTIKKISVPSREIPVAGNYDVVIAGGGPAGVCAAISAARNGAKTLLIERYNHLGGLASGGLVLKLEGFDNGKIPLVKGIPQEIVKRLQKLNGIMMPLKGHNAYHDPECFKWVCLEILQEAGVQILLHSLAVDVIMNGNKLNGLIVENKGGRQAVCAKIIIDTTGDGDIAARSGADYEESRGPVGLVFRLGNINYTANDQFIIQHQKKFNQIKKRLYKIWDGGHIQVFTRTNNDCVVWCNNSLFGKTKNILDAFSLTECEIVLRERIMKTISFLRKNMPGYESCVLLDTASQLGVRYGRLIKGEYMLTEKDMWASKSFDDVICKGGAFWKEGTIYDIPYRCLVPKRIENLLVAGRCFSSSQKGNYGARVIPTCMAMGEAAGAASAISAKKKILPRDIDVPLLQQKLAGQGVFL